jgi:hypothetical protein
MGESVVEALESMPQAPVARVTWDDAARDEGVPQSETDDVAVDAAPDDPPSEAPEPQVEVTAGQEEESSSDPVSRPGLWLAGSVLDLELNLDVKDDDGGSSDDGTVGSPAERTDGIQDGPTAGRPGYVVRREDEAHE